MNNRSNKPSGGFFQKLSARLQRFMYGRYGFDALNLALSVAVFLFFFLDLLIRPIGISIALSLLALLALVLVLLREFSRNIPARRRENEIFGRLWRRISSAVRLVYLRIKERKTHIYRRCPSCHATLRLARRAGEHTVRCPKCGDRFDVKVK